MAIAGPLRVDDDEALSQAVLGGLGVALLPTFIVGGDLQTGRLRAVLSDYTQIDRYVYALYLPTRHLPTRYGCSSISSSSASAPSRTGTARPGTQVSRARTKSLRRDRNGALRGAQTRTNRDLLKYN